MTPASLVLRLRDHATLGGAPDAELEWLAEHGSLARFPAGHVIARPGDSIDHLYVLFSGQIAHHLERPYGLRKVIEWRAGDITGLLPYSRMGTANGTTAALEDTEAVTLSRERMRELPTACPEITAILVHVMLDRARHFTSADLNDRKALALGKVAAGLAHELNNPASALVRSAKTLTETLGAGSHAIPDGPFEALDPAAVTEVRHLYEVCRRRPPANWDPITRADREEAIEGWLTGAGEDPAAAAVLADSPLELDEVLGLADRVPKPGAAAAAICRMARSMAAEQLAKEIEDGAARIFHLVDAVKRFTHMDQTMALDAVDVNGSLRDAVMLVSEKARAADVDLAIDPGDLPEVIGVVEELNQMWQALIDNAVDAAAPGGSVRVSSRCQPGAIAVEIHDDGPGVPAGVRDRIFEPFFTTKPVGAGAGLGLELVRRVVDQHRGDVEFESVPGSTTFRVTLPLPPPDTQVR